MQHPHLAIHVVTESVPNTILARVMGCYSHSSDISLGEKLVRMKSGRASAGIALVIAEVLQCELPSFLPVNHQLSPFLHW